MTTMTQHATGMFCWCQLGTTDLAGARKFYPELFGWTRDDSPMGGTDMTFLKKNGKYIGAMHTLMPQQSEEKKLGPNWMPFVAGDVDRTCEMVRKNGGKVLAEPMDAMDNGRMAVCQDPTSAIFSLWQGRKQIGAEIVNEPGAMCWNELITTDAKRAGEFYRNVFGWTEKPTKGAGGIPYTVFEKDGAQAGGMVQATPEMRLTHPYWMVYFAVDDCDKTAEKAKKLGGEIKMPPTDIPNIGRFAVLNDPQKAYFSIIKMAG